MKTMNERTENAMTSTCALTNDGTTKKAGKGGPSRAFRALAAVAVMMAGAGGWGQGIAVDRIELTKGSDQVTLELRLQGDRYLISMADTTTSKSIEKGESLRGLVAYSIDGGGSWKLHANGGTITDPTGEQLALIRKAKAATEGDVETKAGKGSFYSELPIVYGMQSSNYSIALFDGTLTDPTEVLDPLSIKFRLPAPSSLPSDPVSIKILFIAGGPHQLRALSMDVVPEFFRGEREAFRATEQIKGLSYREKAIVLLGALLGADVAADYRAFAREELGIADTFSAWGVFDPELFKEAKENLHSVLAADLADSTVGEPVRNAVHEFLIPTTQRMEAMFDAVYGGNRSPYHSAYFGFLFRKERPVYASLVKEELASGGVAYDPGAFQTLSKEQGEELAKAALRYLTWGVEYTIPTNEAAKGFDPLARSVKGKPVYEANLPFIAKWLGDPKADDQEASSTDPLRNFLPLKRGAVDPITAVSVYPQYWAVDDKKVETTVEIPILPTMANLLTTPFKDKIAGSPMPYAPGGVDTPRSFAYKLAEALRTRKALYPKITWLESTESTYTETAGKAPATVPYHSLKGILARGKEVLLDPAKDSAVLDLGGVKVTIGGKASVYRPFQIWSFTRTEPFDAFAGVDGLGLLTGAISMTSFRGSVLDLLGGAKAVEFGKYAAFTGADPALPGLDKAGKPIALPIKGLKSLTEGNYSLSRADLEKMTVVIPDLSRLRVGDLLVDFGSGERVEKVKEKEAIDQAPGRQPLHIGIIVGFLGPLPAAGGDPSEFLKNVVVLSIREGFQQVTVGTWGNASGTFGVFTANPKRYQARRLLVSGGVSGGAAVWDLLDRSKATFGIAMEYKEHTRRGSARERWIPNTGEYLEISNLSIIPKGPITAADLKREYMPRFAGLVDRGWRSDETWETSGNVWRNQGAGFDLMLKPEPGFDKAAGIKVLTFRRQDGPEYRVDYSGSEVYTSDGKLRDGWKVEFVVKSGGSSASVMFSRGAAFYETFGLRPLSAAEAYPGDDVRLQIDVVKASTGSTLATARAGEKDYFAVYDKKMLWRANLYIEEAKDDWNELHPWNAPPDSKKQVLVYKDKVTIGGVAKSEWQLVGTADASAWWSEAWGYNEWNRRWKNLKGLADPSSTIASIADLPPGAGDQVIDIPDYTPIRPVSDKARAGNFIGDTVSYSYPYAYQDGHFDSPFDFKKKLDAESTALIAAYKSRHILAFTSTSTIGKKEIKEAPTKSELEFWNSTKAPANVWGRYLMKNLYLDKETRDVPAGQYKSFVPGLGLLKYNVASGFNATYEADLVVGILPVLSGSDARPSSPSLDSSPYPAGTDCIGFAQRTAQYSGDRYTWGSLDAGWAEGGSLSKPNDASTTWDESGQGRAYPVVGDASFEIFMRTTIDFKELVSNPGENLAEQSRIAQIVPGDVFYYRPGHIAIIANVVWDLDDGRVVDIQLIESTFGYTDTGGRITQYVLKYRNLAKWYLRDPYEQYFIVRLKRSL